MTMKEFFLRISKPIGKLLNKYPIVIAAVVIYLYYLMTSFDLFSRKGQHLSFIEYVLQFDSLFFLWLVAVLFLQVQKMKKHQEEERNKRLQFERTLERQQIYEQIVTDITMLLQDNVNNPLAIISVTTQEIRRKFGSDSDIIRWIDRIDGAISRINTAIRDLQAYEAQKILHTTASAVSAVKEGDKK